MQLELERNQLEEEPTIEFLEERSAPATTTAAPQVTPDAVIEENGAYEAPESVVVDLVGNDEGNEVEECEEDKLRREITR